eukprot:scpid74295/ scgid25378/ 
MSERRGVAFVLRGNALKAWRAGGCQSSPLSARVMSLRLRFELENGNTDWITIVTAYAPTFRSKRSAKDEFYASLQNVMNNIAPSEKFILLGGNEICCAAGYHLLSLFTP